MIKKLDKWFGQWHLSTKDIVSDFEKLYGWMMKVVDAAKEVKKWFDKIKGPNIIDAITGDAKNPIFHPPGLRGPVEAERDSTPASSTSSQAARHGALPRKRAASYEENQARGWRS